MPPEPPAAEFPEGGTSGIARDNSTPESIVVMCASAGRGTGERFGVSIVQLRAIVVVENERGEEGVRIERADGRTEN